MRVPLTLAAAIALWVPVGATSQPVGGQSSLADVARTLSTSSRALQIPKAKGSVKGSLDKKDAPVLLASGESRVLLFKLPDYSTTYVLEIHSMCNCLGFSKTIFVPSGVYFGKDFQKTRDIVDIGFLPNMGNGYRLSHSSEVDETRQTDAYLLIYTRDATEGEHAIGPTDPRWVYASRFSGVRKAAHGTIHVETKVPKKK